MSNRATQLLFIALGLLVFIGTAPAHAQQPIWTWTNQYGSTLSVTSYNGTTGAISGTYTNNAQGSCNVGKPQPTTGWFQIGPNGNAISFAVNWQGCASMTVWTGQVLPSGNFQSLWYLSLAAPPAWNGINAGTDTFTLTSGDKAKLMKP